MLPFQSAVAECAEYAGDDDTARLLAGGECFDGRSCCLAAYQRCYRRSPVSMRTFYRMPLISSLSWRLASIEDAIAGGSAARPAGAAPI